MLMQPAILALLGISLGVALALLLAGGLAIPIIRYWDITSGSEFQLTLERRTYLISTLLGLVLAAEILSLFLFVYTAEQLSSQFVGAMCATGVLNVNAFGFPTLLLKIVIFFLAAVWLVLNHVDNQGYDYPLIRIKYGLVLVIALLTLAESILQWRYFLGLDPHIITSCCGTLFSPGSQNLAAELSGIRPLPALLLFYTVALAMLLSGGWFLYDRRRGPLFAGMSALTFATAIVAIISFLSLYIYENPNHHCPFCILKQGYAYVGYWLYIPLFAATACGLGAGVMAPFARLASLRQVVPMTTERLTWLALAGFSLFYLVASYLILTSALVLIGG